MKKVLLAVMILVLAGCDSPRDINTETGEKIVGRFERIGSDYMYDNDRYSKSFSLRDRKTGKCYFMFLKYRGGSLIEEPCPEEY